MSIIKEVLSEGESGRRGEWEKGRVGEGESGGWEKSSYFLLPTSYFLLPSSFFLTSVTESVAELPS
ncbi:MAG TPA: hypothetical protein VIQ31_03245 [Phormidium sp.]